MTKLGRPAKIPIAMQTDTVGGLINTRLDELGYDLHEAVRVTGISYRQLDRLRKNLSTHIQPKTIERLERLGIPRTRLAVAAYAGNGRDALPTPA